MTIYEIVCMIGLIITHAAVYHLGKSTEFEPSDEAWLSARRYAIEKYYEHKRWLAERLDVYVDETEKIT